MNPNPFRRGHALVRNVLIACGLAACAWPIAAGARPLVELHVDARELERHTISHEARFAQTDWQGIEQATLKLADRTIGSFAGEPTGWSRRLVRIHHRSYVHRHEHKGAVVIVPGFTEGLTLYQEVIHDLVVNGYSVYIHDHRGQGFSTRLLEGTDQADKGHIDRFDHLVADLEAFLRLVRQSRQGDPVRARRPVFLLAHSMGGAVTALHLARQGIDTPLSAVALVTPMFEPTVAAADSPRWLDRRLRAWCHAGAFSLPFSVPGLSTRRMRGAGFESDRAAFDALPDQRLAGLTASVTRHRMRWANRAATCEGPHCGHVDARIAGPTFQWVDQACAASDEARGPGAARIAVPVLLLQGGRDAVVEPEAQDTFCANVNSPRSAGGRCVGLRLPEARHGLLVEVDSLRRPALARILSFWDEVAGRAPRSVIGGPTGPTGSSEP